MAIPWPAIPEGSRVRVKQTPNFPQDPALLGHMGTVVSASEYRVQSIGVALDGENEVRYFEPGELEVTSEPAPAPDREAAKQRRALP